MGTILLIILILLLIGALPTWPHSSGWGYYPSGGLGLVLLILIILLLMGRSNEPCCKGEKRRANTQQEQIQLPIKVGVKK